MLYFAKVNKIVTNSSRYTKKIFPTHVIFPEHNRKQTCTPSLCICIVFLEWKREKNLPRGVFYTIYSNTLWNYISIVVMFTLFNLQTITIYLSFYLYILWNFSSNSPSLYLWSSPIVLPHATNPQISVCVRMYLCPFFASLSLYTAYSVSPIHAKRFSRPPNARSRRGAIGGRTIAALQPSLSHRISSNASWMCFLSVFVHLCCVSV